VTQSPPKLMILDACVLIDYIKTESSIFELFVKYVGPLHVASVVSEEVKDIENIDDLIKLGLIIIEPELEDAFTAASQIGRTSFQDRICLLTAKRHGFTCVTNDTNLRKLCDKENVPVLWGLQLLIELHLSGGIPPKNAISVAKEIHKTNPKHIHEQIIEHFIKIIWGHEKK
jgi:predicted nucleic acid-binding protein